jgi:SnoaL-like domain
MTDTTTELLHAYYDTLRGGLPSIDTGRLRAILAPDLVFEGPIAGHRVGADGFILGVRGFVETMRSLSMLQQVCAENEAAALYDAELPGGTMRFAEFFRMEEDKIHSLRLLYDPTQYRALGGR